MTGQQGTVRVGGYGVVISRSLGTGLDLEGIICCG